MRFDLQAFIVALWLTLGITMIGSDYAFKNYDSAAACNPDAIAFKPEAERPNCIDTLDEAIPLVYGFWIAAGMSGFALGFSGLPLNVNVANTLAGYWAAALIRLMFLSSLAELMPGTNRAWSLLANAFQLKGLPQYHLFLLLIFIGGGLFLGIALMVADAIRKSVNLGWLDPAEPVQMRPLAAAVLIPALILFSAIFVQTLRKPVEIPEGYEEQLIDVLLLNGLDWLNKPVPNMIVMAIAGGMIGLSYMSPSKDAAARAVLLGAMLYVVFMMFADVLGGFYTYAIDAQGQLMIGQPTGSGIDYNRLTTMFRPFVAFWLWVPAVGALSAFALHNLRDAFALPATPVERVENPS